MHNFVKRTAVYLRETLPEKTAQYAEEALRRRVKEDVRRAQAYGFTWESSIVRFVEAGFLLERDFDRNPRYDWAGPILRSKEYGEQERSLVLIACASRAAANAGSPNPHG